MFSRECWFVLSLFVRACIKRQTDGQTDREGETEKQRGRENVGRLRLC